MGINQCLTFPLSILSICTPHAPGGDTSPHRCPHTAGRVTQTWRAGSDVQRKSPSPRFLCPTSLTVTDAMVAPQEQASVRESITIHARCALPEPHMRQFSPICLYWANTVTACPIQGDNSCRSQQYMAVITSFTHIASFQLHRGLCAVCYDHPHCAG